MPSAAAVAVVGMRDQLLAGRHTAVPA